MYLEPITRREMFMSKAAGQDVPNLKPITREEWFLNQIAIAAGGGLYSTIQKIVQSGNAPNVFQIGEQIPVKWNDGTEVYDIPFDIVSFENIETINGETKPAMIIQSHYGLMRYVQYDSSEALFIAEESLPAGTYHFAVEHDVTYAAPSLTNWIPGKTYQFTTTKEIPAGGQIVLGYQDQMYVLGMKPATEWKVFTFSKASDITPLESNLAVSEGTDGTDLGAPTAERIIRASYGYGRWSQSGVRQYFNSAKPVGEWWAPQHPYDRPPILIETGPGFMAGLEPEFRNILKPIKVPTAITNNDDTNTIIGVEKTIDTFFLPSVEQSYYDTTDTETEGLEGTTWEYWRQRIGTDTPQKLTARYPNEARWSYKYEDHSATCNTKLRTPSRMEGHYYGAILSKDYGNVGYAYVADRSLIACAIF